MAPQVWTLDLLRLLGEVAVAAPVLLLLLLLAPGQGLVMTAPGGHCKPPGS
jgi:hypothetical protein